jgi:penicillin G amidase
VAPVDMFELWRQPRHPDHADQVASHDGHEPLISRTEVFAVRDRDQHHEQVFHYTSRGQVIEMNDESVLVMQWAGFDLPVAELIDSALAIHLAEDFESFRQAATQVGALSVNWSYSDRQGNIGYVQSTAIPQRRHEQFFSLLDSTNPDHGWDGFHPPDDRPFALNPPKGWLANANNHAAGADWPYPIPGFYKQLRMRRITSLLDQDRRFDADDMTAFQLDRHSDRALSWKPWLADLAEASGRTPLAEELRAWDGNMSIDSDLAGLFSRWWHALPQALFSEPDSPDWRVMSQVIDEWLHDQPDLSDHPNSELDEAGQAALNQALSRGRVPLGAIQQLTIRHPMGQDGLLNRWLRLSRGPIPVGGDAASLNVSYSAYNPETATLRSRAGASMRFVMDWADPDSFRLNLTLGQSGHPSSPHFDDFLLDFLNGTPWTVPWTRAKVEAGAAHRLRLVPDRG